MKKKTVSGVENLSTEEIERRYEKWQKRTDKYRGEMPPEEVLKGRILRSELIARGVIPQQVG